MDKFHNKNGTLTPYAFACGYIEETEGVQLSKDGCWHVRAWPNGKERVWESFDGSRGLSEARAFFRKLVRSIRWEKKGYEN